MNTVVRTFSMAEFSDSRPSDTTSDDEVRITLGLLSAVENDSTLTHRSASRELGIALGLTNAYLKRCVRKGLIKVKQVPRNRYAYYLTPKGFAEKSRLTAEYLAFSFYFFRDARNQCSRLFAQCAARGYRRIALAGASDLAEIAVLCALDHGVSLVGIVDRDPIEQRFAGLPVAARLSDLGPVHAVIVTDFRNPQAAFDALVETMPQERVLVPVLLNVSRVRPTLAGDEEARPS